MMVPPTSRTTSRTGGGELCRALSATGGIDAAATTRFSDCLRESLTVSPWYCALLENRLRKTVLAGKKDSMNNCVHRVIRNQETTDANKSRHFHCLCPPNRILRERPIYCVRTNAVPDTSTAAATGPARCRCPREGAGAGPDEAAGAAEDCSRPIQYI